MPPTPAERFGVILHYLILAVAAMSGGDRLSFPMIGFINARIREIKLRITRIAERLRDGTYVPRRTGPRRPPAIRRPWQPSKLPTKRGWLLKLVPDAVCFRSKLEILLCDPEMAALLAAAPEAIGRPFRSLCWMLRMPPPKILARPKKPRKPRKTPAAAPEPAPSKPEPPAWMPRRTRWTLTRIRGSPRPA